MRSLLDALVLLGGLAASTSAGLSSQLAGADPEGTKFDASVLVQGEFHVTSDSESGVLGARKHKQLRPGDGRDDSGFVALLMPSAGQTSIGFLDGNNTTHSKASLIFVCVAPVAFIIISWFLPFMHEKEGDTAEQEPAKGLKEPAKVPEEIVGYTEPRPAPEEEAPASTWELVRKVRFLWPLNVLSALSAGIAGPGGAYIGLNFFATHHTTLPKKFIHCDLAPQMFFCREAVMDLTRINVLIGFVNPIVQVLLGPALGVISDAYGRRCVLVTCSLLGLLPTIAMAMHMYGDHSLYLFYWLTPFAHIPSAAVSYAYAVDCIQHAPSIAACFGLMGAVGALCQLIGMLIGSALSLQTAFTLGFAMGLVSLTYVLLVLPESLPPAARKALDKRMMLPGMGLRILVRHALLSRLALIAIISHFVDSGFNAISGSFLQLYMQWTRKATYICSMLGSISSILWLGFGLGALTRLSGEVGALNVSRWSCVICGILFMLSTQVWQVWCLQAVFAGPVAVGIPAIAALKGRLVTQNEQGLMQGALNTVTSIAGSLGPPALGVVFQAVNTSTVRTAMSNLTMVYGVVLSMPVLLLLLTLPYYVKRYIGGERRPAKRMKA